VFDPAALLKVILVEEVELLGARVTLPVPAFKIRAVVGKLCASISIEPLPAFMVTAVDPVVVTPAAELIFTLLLVAVAESIVILAARFTGSEPVPKIFKAEPADVVPPRLMLPKTFTDVAPEFKLLLLPEMVSVDA
jgi:hypothetical protein